MGLPAVNEGFWITSDEQKHLLNLLETTPNLDDTLLALRARLQDSNDHEMVLQSDVNGAVLDVASFACIYSMVLWAVDIDPTDRNPDVPDISCQGNSDEGT